MLGQELKFVAYFPNSVLYRLLRVLPCRPTEDMIELC